MTDEQIVALLVEIEQREQATTEGPWCQNYYDSFGGYWEVDGPQGEAVAGMDNEAQDKANANFIAHARADIPTLVALVRQLMADRRKARLLLAEASDTLRQTHLSGAVVLTERRINQFLNATPSASEHQP